MLLQADVNDNDEDGDNNHEPPEATSPPKEPEHLIEGFNEPESPQKLYPTAPQLDESDESAHSTEV